MRFLSRQIFHFCAQSVLLQFAYVIVLASDPLRQSGLVVINTISDNSLISVGGTDTLEGAIKQKKIGVSKQLC